MSNKHSSHHGGKKKKDGDGVSSQALSWQEVLLFFRERIQVVVLMLLLGVVTILGTMSSVERTSSALAIEHVFPKQAWSDEQDALPAWEESEAILASDDERYSSVSLEAVTGDASISQRLVADDFSIPLEYGAKIEGIAVTVEKHATTEQVRDVVVTLLKDGEPVGNRALESPWKTRSEQVVYGGATDLWDASWDRDAIVNQRFGVALQVQNYGAELSSIAFVDSISVDVYYTLPKSAQLLPLSQVTEESGDGQFPPQHPGEESAEGQQGNDGAVGLATDPMEGCRFFDDFSGGRMDAGWFWLSENDAMTSLTAIPGSLVISTEQGTLWGYEGEVNNLLLRRPPEGDFSITTKMRIPEGRDQVQAGLVAYGDEDTFLEVLGVRYAGRSSVVTVREEEGKGDTFEVPSAGSEVFLRLTRKGMQYITSMSSDGRLWQELKRISITIPQVKVGLVASNGEAVTSTTPIAFDFVCIKDATAQVPSPTPVSAAVSGETCTFVDQFSGGVGEGWQWLRENASAWDTDVTPGFLRLLTEQGSLWGTGGVPARNVLLRQAPGGNFSIMTKMTFIPSSITQQLGLMLYSNDDTFLQTMRVVYPGNSSVVTAYEVQGKGDTVEIPSRLATVYLRITRVGDAYVSAYSPDGSVWSTVGQGSLDFVPQQIGIFATNGTAQTSLSPVEVDFFCVNDFALSQTTPTPIVLPTDTVTPEPPTATPTFSFTPSFTPSPMPTFTPEPTLTPTPIPPTATFTSTAIPTTASLTPTVTQTKEMKLPTETSSPTATATVTFTPSPVLRPYVIPCPDFSMGVCDDFYDDAMIDLQLSDDLVVGDSRVTIAEGQEEAMLTSLNMLYGYLRVDALTSLLYTVVLPEGARVSLQVSNDGVSWYDDEGVEDGLIVLQEGLAQQLSLEALGWTGARFYYRIFLQQDGAHPPIVENISVVYAREVVPTPSPSVIPTTTISVEETAVVVRSPEVSSPTPKVAVAVATPTPLSVRYFINDETVRRSRSVFVRQSPQQPAAIVVQEPKEESIERIMDETSLRSWFERPFKSATLRTTHPSPGGYNQYFSEEVAASSARDDLSVRSTTLFLPPLIEVEPLEEEEEKSIFEQYFYFGEESYRTTRYFFP